MTQPTNPNTKPILKYIKSPPPSDEKSHFAYLEEQFQKIEDTNARQVYRIEQSNDYATALVVEEASARSNAISAEATARQALTSRVTANEGNIGSLSGRMSTAESAITTEAATRANADAAEATARQALASRVTATEGDVSSLGSRLTTAESAITAEAATRANADAAEATARQTLASRVTVNEGNISSLGSRVSSTETAITNEASTRANADSALATTTTSLVSTVNSRVNVKRTWRQSGQPPFYDMFPPRTNICPAASLDRSDYYSGGSGIYGQTNTGLSLAGSRDLNSDFTLSGEHTLWLAVVGTMSSFSTAYRYFDIFGFQCDDIVAGKTYEFSVYTGVIRCRAQLQILFYDASGTFIVGFASSIFNDNEFTGGSQLSTYKRLHVFGLAPTNATRAICVVRADNGGSVSTPVNPFLFITRPYLGILPAGETTPTDWQRFEAPVWYDTSNNNKLYVWNGIDNQKFQATDDPRIDTNTAAITTEATTRASADSALSNRVTTIEASVTNSSTTGGILARLVTEETARATADSALSTRINNLVVESGNSTAAAIDAETTARIAGDNALATQITTVSAKATAQRVFRQTSAPSTTDRIVGDLWYDSDDGNRPYVWNGSSWIENSDTRFTTLGSSITDEATARANAISTEATARQALASRVTTTEGNITSLDGRLTTAEAGITSEATTRATADTALSNRVTTVESSVTNTTGGGVLARLITEESTRATADTALSNRVSTVESSVTNTTGGGVLARIISEENTRASADSALSSQISSVSAQAGAQRIFRQTNAPSSTGRITGDLWYDLDDNNKPYYWNGSSWVDVTDQRILTNSADITNETSARVSGDTALANSITSLSSTVNGQSSSISTLQSTTANINGALSNQWAVVGNINGVTGGLSLTGIKKADGTGATYNLEINANTSINGNLVVAGSITGSQISVGGVGNGNIANNAVSNSAYARATNTPSSPASVTISLRAGARVSILTTYDGGDDLGFNATTGTLTARVNNGNFTNNSITIRPSTSGIGVTTWVISGVQVVTSAFARYNSGPVTLLTYYTAPSTGTYTVTAFAGSGFGQGVNLLVMELSK